MILMEIEEGGGSCRIKATRLEMGKYDYDYIEYPHRDYVWYSAREAEKLYRREFDLVGLRVKRVYS